MRLLVSLSLATIMLVLSSVGAISVSDASYTYIGCYADAELRDLPFTYTDRNTVIPTFLSWSSPAIMTVDICYAVAKQYGFNYFGLQYSNQCYLGNSYGKYGVAATTCNLPCSGNYGQVCGASWTNSVYSVNDEATALPVAAPAGAIFFNQVEERNPIYTYYSCQCVDAGHTTFSSITFFGNTSITEGNTLVIVNSPLTPTTNSPSSNIFSVQQNAPYQVFGYIAPGENAATGIGSRPTQIYINGNTVTVVDPSALYPVQLVGSSESCIFPYFLDLADVSEFPCLKSS